MRTFERWEWQESPHGPVIRLRQTGRIWVNVLVGVGMVAGGIWLAGSTGEGGFGITLAFFGLLYGGFSLMALGDTRITRLGRATLTFERKEGEPNEEWPRERVAAVHLVRKRREGRRRTPHFPWRVILRDADGERFAGRFRFAKERVAREFADELASSLSVGVQTED